MSLSLGRLKPEAQAKANVDFAAGGKGFPQ